MKKIVPALLALIQGAAIQKLYQLVEEQQIEIDQLKLQCGER